jgi:hypothetical protein
VESIKLRLLRQYFEANYSWILGYARKRIVSRLSLAGKLAWSEDSNGNLRCIVTDTRYALINRQELDDYASNVIAYAWARLVKRQPNGPINLAVFGAVRDSIGKCRSNFGKGRGNGARIRTSELIHDSGKDSGQLPRIECKELALMLPHLLEGRAKLVASMLVMAYLREDNPPSREEIASRLGVSVRLVSEELRVVRSSFNCLLYFN